MLVADGLVKRFGRRVAVDDLGLEVRRGEIYGLLGPNGAGKTTAILMLCGVLARDAGRVTIDGIDLDRGPAARARIGFAPQWLGLYLDLTGRENLEFWGRMYDLEGRALARAVDAALAAVGLEGRAGELAAVYSGGMLRRLNLASALLHAPPLLVLDEPTAGVDPQSRNAIFELLARLRAEGAAILYTTHYMEEAERLCDRIGIIDAGRLRAEGTRRELVGRLGEAVRIDVAFALGAEAGAGAELARGAAASLPGVESAALVDGGLRLTSRDAPSVLPSLVQALVVLGLAPASVAVVEPNLEDVFLRHTGKALRD
jgi:ABC-2 type transport system ATP-binding protein